MDEEVEDSSGDELLNYDGRSVRQRTNGGGRGSTAAGRGGGRGSSTTTGRGRGGSSTAAGRGRGGSSTAALANFNVDASTGNENGLGGDTTSNNSNTTGAGRLRQLGHFVSNTGAIRSPEHAAGLIGILQLAKAERPGGIHAALGHGNRITWVSSKLEAFFAATGPLGCFIPVTVNVLLRHLREAEQVARHFHNQRHSSDQSGSTREDIPGWVGEFFQLFEAASSHPTNSSQADAARSEQRSVVASLTGRQAPLGIRNGPAQLRTETTRNRGAPVMRQQIVGNVDAETVYEGGDEEGDEFAEEGYGDVVHRYAAPRRRTINGTRQRNIHLDFSPDGNDPSSRYSSIVGAYSSIDLLGRAVARSMEGPPRTFLDISNEYQAVANNLRNAVDEHAKAFHSIALQGLSAELQRMVPTGAGNIIHTTSNTSNVSVAAGENGNGDAGNDNNGSI